jgi:hypothetical protein
MKCDNDKCELEARVFVEIVCLKFDIYRKWCRNHASNSYSILAPLAVVSVHLISEHEYTLGRVMKQ